jgi:hypothetical protein
MIHTTFAFWGVSRGKHPLSRRRFLQAAAGTVGALSAGFLLPRRASAQGDLT